MAGSGRKNGSDSVLAAALVSGMTHEQAAEVAGVSVRTVGRRMADPEFRKLIDAEQDRVVGRFTGMTVAGMEKAINRLTKLTDSDIDGVALGACRTLLEFAIRLREHSTLTRRLAALEAARSEPTNETEGPGEAGAEPVGDEATELGPVGATGPVDRPAETVARK